jgi:hypothetical protein
MHVVQAFCYNVLHRVRVLQLKLGVMSTRFWHPQKLMRWAFAALKRCRKHQVLQAIDPPCELCCIKYQVPVLQATRNNASLQVVSCLTCCCCLSCCCCCLCCFCVQVLSWIDVCAGLSAKTLLPLPNLLLLPFVLLLLLPLLRAGVELDRRVCWAVSQDACTRPLRDHQR